MTAAPLTVERVTAWDPAALGTAASGLDDVRDLVRVTLAGEPA